MRFLLYTSLIVGLTLIIVQCHSDDTIWGEVSVSVIAETIEISNNYGKPISYFAVEAEKAQLINWAAGSGEDNTIASGDVKSVSWSKIMSDGLLQSGDRIILYWWIAQSDIVVPAAMNQTIVVL